MRSFEEVYRTHVHAVFRFALSVVGTRELAEDLTSDAFLTLGRHFDTIDQAQLPGWLITVVRNRARDWWRHQEVEKKHIAESLPNAVATVPPIEQSILDSVALKPVHKACLMLRYGHGMSRTEIAAQMGLSENQVKGHLQYALSLLRKQLEVR